jgi:hypothetical protein
MTVVMIQRGVFQNRLLIELLQNPGGSANCVLTVSSAGELLPAEISLDFQGNEQLLNQAEVHIPEFGKLRALEVRLPPAGYRDVKIWAHQMTPTGDSLTIPARVEVDLAGKPQSIDLSISGGWAIIPVRDGAAQTFREVKLSFDSEEFHSNPLENNRLTTYEPVSNQSPGDPQDDQPVRRDAG